MCIRAENMYSHTCTSELEALLVIATNAAKDVAQEVITGLISCRAALCDPGWCTLEHALHALFGLEIWLSALSFAASLI